MAVIEIDIDTLAYPSTALSEILANETAQRGASRAGAEAMQKADADARGVGLGRGHALVILELTRQVGLRKIVEQRRCLGRNARRRDGVVGKRDPRRVGIVDGDRGAFLGGKAREIALALRRRWAQCRIG